MLVSANKEYDIPYLYGVHVAYQIIEKTYKEYDIPYLHAVHVSYQAIEKTLVVISRLPTSILFIIAVFTLSN